MPTSIVTGYDNFHPVVGYRSVRTVDDRAAAAAKWLSWAPPGG